MRLPIRSLATLLLAVGVATCSDAPLATVKSASSPVRSNVGRIGLVPVFSKSAQFAATHADQFGVSFDSVHIVIRGLPDTTVLVKDTVIFFTSDSPPTSLELTVPVLTDHQRFDAGMRYTFGEVVQYSGHAPVTSYPAGQTPPDSPTIEIHYAGVGSNLARITLAPRAVSLMAPQTTTFTVTGTDSTGANATLPQRLLWTSSDPSIATVSNTGMVTPAGRRGTVTITAQAPNLISDNVSVTVALPPAAIAVVSGGGQTGKVGATLPTSAVVQLSAGDGLGVAGVSVLFSAPVGGSVGAASATTDANGRASTTLKLGTVAGTQGFGATAGVLAVGISATATAGDAAAIAVVSGSGQSDTVKKALKNPLVVKVSDAFNNPVAGAVVSWARTGTGVLSVASTTTGADGTTNVGYTLGTTVGNESVSASTVGAATSASFSMTALSAAATNIAVVAGGAQSGTVGTALAAPFVVRVTDDAGNPAAGAIVAWTGVNGTIAASTTSDATGLTSATFTLGRVAGAASATATLPNGRFVAFSATATAGLPVALIWRAQPASSLANTILAPALQVALVDADKNTTASTSAITLSLSGGTSGATLGGALTKNATGGVATFSDLKIDRAGTGYTLVASTPGLTTTYASSAFSLTASVATQLLLVPSSPTSFTYVAGVTPVSPPSLKTADVGGAGVANVPVRVEAVVIQNGQPVTVQDVTLTSDANGLVVFTGSLPTTAGAYFLKASSTAISGASVTVPVTITPAAASTLAFLSQPANTRIGVSFAPFVVQVRDAFSNVVSGATSTVTLNVTSGSNSANLSGRTVNAVNGSATFSSFSMDVVDVYTLSATSSPLTPATSSSFLVMDERAVAFVATPSAAQTNGVALSPQPVIQLNDGTANHNPVHKSGVVITATVSPAPGSTNGTLNNTATFTRSGTVTATTDTSGRATFTNLGILSTQGGLTGRLTFTVTSGTTQTIAAITSDVVVNAGAAVTIQRSTNLVLSTLVGTALPTFPAVRLLDVAGSPVPSSAGVSISFSVPSGLCSTSAVLSTTASGGTASLSSSNLTVPDAAGSCVVRATSSSLSGSPIDFDIVVGPASGFTWLGAIDDDYARNFNWQGLVAPGAGVNIYVPKSVPNSLKVAAATTVGDVTLEAGASFKVSSDVLTINGTTSAGTGSTFTVSGGTGAKALFHGANTTLGNLNVAARTVQFDNDATITGNVVATDTATIKHTGVRVLTVAGSLTSDPGTTLSGLRTVKFTGSTFPVYGNATTAGTPLETQISHNMSVPSGVSSFVNNLTVSDAALSVNGNGTTLIVGSALDVKSSTGASGELLMNSGDPTVIVTGVAIFEGKAQNGQGLTTGTLDLRGDFIQRDRTTGSHGEFEPGPAPFLVKLTGGGSGQTVSFDHPGTSPGTESYFTNVLVTNQGGVTQSSHAYINGGTMTVGGSPADAITPAMWATGSGHTLFVAGGSALQIRQSGQLTVTAGGALDLSGGTCRTFPGSLVQNGNVAGGSCTIDGTLNGSVGDLLRGRYLALR